VLEQILQENIYRLWYAPGILSVLYVLANMI